MSLLDGIVTKMARNMYAVAGSLVQKQTNGYIIAVSTVGQC